MLDTIDAAFWDPFQDCAWFFRGQSVIKWQPGTGIVPLSGNLVRTLGVDAWPGIPQHFLEGGIDAAFFYPWRQAYYFFAQGHYARTSPNAPGAWTNLREVGVDGWNLPAGFRVFDTAFFYGAREHAYFFRGDEYIKYKPGAGPVQLGNNAIRRLRVDGWVGLPFAGEELGAVMDYEPNGASYFFCKRDYARWEPGDGVEPRYPRRIGLVHGIDILDSATTAVSRGGWPGLSHFVAGPIVGNVTPRSAVIWVWLTSPELKLRLKHNNAWREFAAQDVVPGEIATAVDLVQPGGVIRHILLENLQPADEHRVELILDDTVLDAVKFRTPPEPSATGKVRLLVGSCSDFSKHAAANVLEAMRKHGRDPHLALLVGDNCYYVAGNRATSHNGPAPRDWESAHRMLLRQLQARNHPQFVPLSRTLPVWSTWDDHDFAFNNSTGAHLQDGWVGRDVAAAVFRAMWPNPYAAAKSVEHSFRWGPVEVFLTDSRFFKDKAKHIIWGEAQLQALIASLQASTAPVKIVVVSTQFLVQHNSEGHVDQALAERNALLTAIVDGGKISGRVLFVTGDIHGSEILRFPSAGAAKVIEATSSPVRRESDSAADEFTTAAPFEATRVWGRKKDAFMIITVEVEKGLPEIAGSVVIEGRDEEGELLREVGTNVECRSSWNLGTRALTTP